MAIDTIADLLSHNERLVLWLERIMKENKIKKPELAVICKIPLSTLRNVLIGKSVASATTHGIIIALVRHYGLAISDRLFPAT